MTEPLVLRSTTNGVMTLTMNNPRKLNGWTAAMMGDVKAALDDASSDDATKVVILTGADPYYCAGVNLAGALKLEHPKKMKVTIEGQNFALFGLFIDFNKPIIVAANGPAIGGAVTSATLCDAIVASDKATFSTPFARLGVTPEGCSSVLFARLMGADNAERMLGSEGYVPTSQEALAMGLIDQVVPHESLLETAQALAETWIAEGRKRQFRGGLTHEEATAINAAESPRLAEAFLDTPFILGQANFLRKKKKWGPAALFYSLWVTRPIWSRLP